MKRKKACPICRSTSTRVFLSRNPVPVHQNVVMRSQQAAESVETHRLDMAVCRSCGFIFNQSFDLRKVGYGESYDNNQACSPLFESYLNDLVHYLLNEKKVRHSRIVEVGCGQGHFLKKLVAAKGAHNVGFGFDPSYKGPRKALHGRLTFELKYYGPDSADLAADVVICRHVIEHVPDPLSLLRSVRKALAASSDARVFFETPCAEWILKHQVIWDFFYEHCSLFTKNSLAAAFETAGFNLKQVSHVFGGQYLWIEAEVGGSPAGPRLRAGRVAQLAERYSVAEKQVRERWISLVNRKSKNGKLALWGAGAKGSTFLNLVDRRRTLIDSIVDVNPNKQGCYIPGTGHRIIRPKELASRDITDVILMNPNYRNEIAREIKKRKMKVNLI